MTLAKLELASRLVLARAVLVRAVLSVAAFTMVAPLSAQPPGAAGGGAAGAGGQLAERRGPRTPQLVVIDSVTVIDVINGRSIANQRIVIRGDSIAAVEALSRPLPDSINEYVNGKGAFAIPGLTDHHVHLDAGMDRMLQQAARGGVTMVMNVAGDNRIVSEYARRTLTRQLAGPEIGYVSVMAGPGFFVDPRFKASEVGFASGTAPWIQAVTDETNVPMAIALARGSGAESLKLYAMLDSSLTARLISEAHRQGMTVIAHGTLFPARPLQMVQGGLDVLTHAPYLAWQGATEVKAEDSFTRRERAPYASVPVDGPAITALLEEMKRRGTWLEPTLAVFARSAEEKDVNDWGRALTRRANSMGIPILAGTDGLLSGRDSTALPGVHHELELLVDAGLSNSEALASATINAARAMRRDNTHGSIAAGRVADVLLLDANPLESVSATTRIRRVVLRGRLLDPLPRIQ